MELALRTGIGAISAQGVPYNDTGDGITPDNFQSSCCGDPLALTTPSCSTWIAQNPGKFGSYSPCSSAAQQALTFPNLPPPTAPVVPAGGYTPLPLTGEPSAILAEIATRSAAGDLTQNQAAAAAILVQQCAQQKASCADNYLLTKPTADCTGCTFDFGTPGVWMLIGITALVALFLVKK